MTCDTPTIEWRENIARPKLPMDGIELRLLANLMLNAGGRWSTAGGGWVFKEDAFTAFHRVPDGCQFPSPYVQNVGDL